jgi:hypothetical protein
MTILIEISTAFSENYKEHLALEDEDIEVALAKGLGGERIVKILLKATKPAIDKVTKWLNNAARPDVVTTIKISNKGVEIGNLRTQDADEIKKFTLEILDKLKQ